MIVLTALFSVSMPVNAYSILIEIMQITNFDIVDISELLNGVMTLTPFAPFSFVFEEAGYDTTNFFIELGAIFLLIVSFPLLLLVRFIVRRIAMKFRDNCCTRRLKVAYNYKMVILRFLIEGALELGLSAMICVKTVSETCLVSKLLVLT